MVISTKRITKQNIVSVANWKKPIQSLLKVAAQMKMASDASIVDMLSMMSGGQLVDNS